MSDTAMSARHMGIIRDPRVGCDDRFGKCRLLFTVYTDACSAFGAYVDFPEAVALIEASGVEDVRQLDGKPCYWRQDGAFCRFAGLWAH